jgi:hypothetical protein
MARPRPAPRPLDRVPGEQGEHLLAAHVPARRVDEHGPVGVAVVGDPELGARGGHGPLKVDEVRLGGFGEVAGEGPVDVGVQGHHAASQGTNESGARRNGSSVPAVEHDRELPASQAGHVDLGADTVEVAADPSGVAHHLSDPVVRDR